MDARRVIPAILSIAGAALKLFFDSKIADEKVDKAIEASKDSMNRKLDDNVTFMIEQKAVNKAADAILTAVKQVKAEESSDSEISEEKAEEAPE